MRWEFNCFCPVFCSLPVLEFLLLVDVGESRSEPLYICRVASSVMCVFNHPVAQSFSKTCWICAEAAHHPSDGFAVRERRDWILVGGKKEIRM